MEKWQSEYIRSNLDDLVDYTTINTSLLSYLQSYGILTRSDISELEVERCNKGRMAENLKLYTIVQGKGDNAFEQLIKAFENVRQTHIVNVLKQAKSVNSTDSSQKDSQANQLGNSVESENDKSEEGAGGMEPWQRELITANLDKLKDITILRNMLLWKLLVSDHLSRMDMEELDAEQNQVKKNLKFYEIIQTKGNNSYDAMIQAFEESKQSGVLYILRKTGQIRN